MKVKDAMHHGVKWFGPDTPVSQLAKAMEEEDIGSIPIGENDKLIGMVTDRDIVLRSFKNGMEASQKRACDVMSKGIQFCRESDDLDDALERMEEKKIRRLPVIDSNKRLVGMLSLGDIASAGTEGQTKEFVTSVSAHHP